MAGHPRTKPKTPAAGSSAAPMHGHYAVRPGTADAGPEYFEADLAGMNAAIARAAWLSVSTGRQEVSVTRLRVRGRVLFRYEGGRCTLRPGCLIPAQAAAS